MSANVATVCALVLQRDVKKKKETRVESVAEKNGSQQRRTAPAVTRL